MPKNMIIRLLLACLLCGGIVLVVGLTIQAVF